MHSRRSFLKLLGITTSTVIALPLGSRFTLDLADVNQGRAFDATSIFAQPDLNSAVLDTLWPDSIMSIVSEAGDWYRVPGGFVPRAALQPMGVYDPEACAYQEKFPFWAEVAAPSASVRALCAADAPLVTRVGHGGVLQVVDGLPGEPLGWYRVEDGQGRALGWTQANRWRVVRDEPSAFSAQQKNTQRSVLIDAAKGNLRAFEGNDLILQARFSRGGSLSGGDYPLQGWQAGGGVNSGFQGIPWQTHFGDGYTIAGAYWHNRFGQVTPGPVVQVPPLLARWLYQWLNTGSVISVA